MKGVILAGGTGSRLRPLTGALSKQLLPVYDKPMIYYPLSVLMLAGVSDVQIISAPEHTGLFRSLLGDGSRLGMSLSYAEQAEPRGIAEAFLIAEEHIGDSPVALILGDNVFHGPGFSSVLARSIERLEGCELFGYPVKDPHRYGVGELDTSGRLISLVEKPREPRSNLAVTGLYFYDNQVLDIARRLTPSSRGELEITDVNNAYLARGTAHLTELGRGFAWLDMGTHDSLLQAGQYVQLLEQRQGERIACLEEIAMRMGFITPAHCHDLGVELSASSYGRYLVEIARQHADRDGLHRNALVPRGQPGAPAPEDAPPARPGRP